MIIVETTEQWKEHIQSGKVVGMVVEVIKRACCGRGLLWECAAAAYMREKAWF